VADEKKDQGFNIEIIYGLDSTVSEYLSYAFC
jgi:hypothetical protein